jgi:hypothetical protein
MDLPTLVAAVTGQPITPESLRSAVVHVVSLAPLLPAIVLAVVAVARGTRMRHLPR